MRIVYILITAILFATASAGNFDGQTLSDRELTGTARYVGMAGAMTAVGGDESAVSDNPASLGVMRRSMVSLSMGWSNNCKGVRGDVNSRTNIFMVPNAALIFSFGNDDKYTGLVRSNIMIGYRQLCSFSGRAVYNFQSPNRYSLAHSVASLTNTNPYSQYLYGYLSQESSDAFNDERLGWLSVLMAKEGIITSDDNGETWSASGRQADAQLSVNELGSVNEFSFAWGLNISHQWYVGLGLNVHTLSYDKTTAFSESFMNSNTGSYTLTSQFSARGTLIAGNIGLICHPVSFLRVGASFCSPTIGKVDVANCASAGRTETPVNLFRYSRYSTPLRASFGVAFQFGTSGLLSAQYDYSHSVAGNADMYSADVHDLRFGAEWRAYKRMYLRVGYAYKWAADRKEPFSIDYTDTRTDIEYRLAEKHHYATAGIGYRGRYFNVEGAYRLKLSSSDFYAYPAQDIPLKTSDTSHAVVVTIAWHN